MSADINNNWDMNLDILHEQAYNYFTENMVLDKQIVKLRDENLELRSHMFHEIVSIMHEKLQKYIIDKDTCGFKSLGHYVQELLRNSLTALSEHSHSVHSEIKCRKQDLSHIKFIRDYCSIMEHEYNQRVQDVKSYYMKMIEEMSSELQYLKNSMSAQSSDEDVKDNSLQCAIADVEKQNEYLTNELSNRNETIKNLNCKINQLRAEKEKDQSRLFQAQSTHRYSSLQTQNCIEDQLSDLKLELENKCREVMAANDLLRKSAMDYSELCQRFEFNEKQWERDQEKLNKMIQSEGRLRAELSILKDELEAKYGIENSLRDKIESITTELCENAAQFQARERILHKDLTITKKSLTEHSRDLQLQTKTIQDLEQKNILLNDKVLYSNAEVNRLKEELEHCKEKLACIGGKESMLTKLLEKSNLEIHELRNDVTKLQDENGLICDTLETNKHLIKENNKLKDRLSALGVECNSLNSELNTAMELKEKAVIALKKAMCYQKEHAEREQLINKKLSKQTEHIKTLLDDRKKLISKINDMGFDLNTMKRAADLYREMFHNDKYCGPNNSSLVRHQSSRIVRYRSDPSLNESDRKLKTIHLVTRRIYKARKQLENDVGAQNSYNE